MHGLTHEVGSFGANPGAKDLARHLFTRMTCGKVVIVTDKPNSVLSALRRQWLKLARKVQRERASTLNATRIFEMSQAVQRMHALRFTTKWPDDYEAEVCIVTIDQLMRWAPECKTLYITCNVELEKLHIITALMPRNALLVTCKLHSSEQ